MRISVSFSRRFSEAGAPERTHSVGKFLARHHGLGAGALPGVVDRLDRAVEELRDSHGVGQAQAHQGVDAQLGVEEIVRFQFNLFLGTEQGVEIPDEVGIYAQEDFVECPVEFLVSR